MTLDRALLLILCLVGLLCSSSVSFIFSARWRRSWLMTGLLVPASVAAAALVAASIWAGDWFLLVPAVGLAVMLAVGWDMNLGARRGDGGRFLAFLARRIISRKRWTPRADGRPMQPMDALRAEYGQSVLDDARRDPALAHVVDQAAAALEERIFGGRSRELPLVQIEAYANGLIEGATEPGRGPSPRVYLGYSSAMIAIAALCQLHDRYGPVRSRT